MLPKLTRCCYGKYFRRTLLLRNVLTVKHHTLKINVFELLDKKNIGKLLSKYETFFLD